MKQSKWFEGLKWAERAVKAYGLAYVVHSLNKDWCNEFKKGIEDYIEHYMINYGTIISQQ